MNKEQTKNENVGKVLQGTVVSTGMQNTAKVAVARYVKHPKYKKFIKRVKNYLVHDEGNTVQMGDKVDIQETRPISKNKHFKIVKTQ